MNNKLYQKITDQIVAELKKGRIPWQKPWFCAAGILSHATGKAYSFINSLILGNPGEYVTYKQALAEGGNVRKGAVSKHVYFYQKQKVERIEKDENGNEVKTEKTIPLLKTYCVFHVTDDCEGLTPKFQKENKQGEGSEPIEAAERVIREYTNREQIKIQLKAIDRAYFSPSEDLIQVPPMENFKESNDYYDTLFHEITHSTGMAKRLDRPGITDKSAVFGTKLYADEELVAELGACFIMNSLGISTKTTDRQNAAYIQSWLGKLQNDPSMIIRAANRAEKAVNFIMGGT